MYIFEMSVLALCAVLSMFFSGVEFALFSLSKADMYRYAGSGDRIEKALYRLMTQPHRILVTILIGNLLVNLIMSMLSTRLLLYRWGNWGHFIAMAVLTPLIIIFCEITPKAIAINTYEAFSKKAYPLLMFFHSILLPLRFAIDLITGTIIRLFGLTMSHKTITEDELGMAVRIGVEEGMIDKREGDFISNVMRFSKHDASRVMFPRNGAVFIPETATVQEAMEIFKEREVIRAPVYRGNLDTIVGMVDSREILPAYMGYKSARSIKKFIHEINFFPATRELNDLLNDFIAGGIQIAVMLDEYGGTAGILTLNKILSELMGKEFINWEKDPRRSVRKAGARITIIHGEMLIEDFNAMFDERISSENAYTVGGYILEKKADFPRRGEIVPLLKHDLRVRYIKRKKIESIEVIEKPEVTGR